MAHKKSAIAKKTAYLIKEGKPAKQAYAIANSMSRSHKLTPTGHYKRKGMKKNKTKFGELAPSSYAPN